MRVGVRTWLRPILWVVVMAVLVTAVSVLVLRRQPPTEDELLRQAGVGDTLYVGATGTQPGISDRNPRTSRWSGFDVDIALMIAGALRIPRDDVKFCRIRVEDRGRGTSADPDCGGHPLHMVVAAYSMTPDRVKAHALAGPYLVTTSSVLTRRGHPTVKTLRDLKGQSVCMAGTATSQSLLERAGADVRATEDTVACVRQLLAGDVDAVSTDTAILAGFLRQHRGRLAIHNISSDVDERWGVNVLGNDPLRTLVDLALEQARASGAWRQVFRRWFGEKTTTLVGQQVAEPVQPKVFEPPRVRRLPWDRRTC
ncbi:transporter substrate-binding domain-containing protein [Actinoplanes rectilineatus]|uniref:transporter substrate-binding domain-containing protein n=1 Tax=Actinoplanes rectilineatus TaxID=113571 RepID=UPI000A5FB754|nr:transporter substrate-binding domain-containing protein [Actinoplanes rectilineatus]